MINADVHDLINDVDEIVYEFCKEHCPDKIPAWYDDGGIYEWIAGLVDLI